MVVKARSWLPDEGVVVHGEARRGHSERHEETFGGDAFTGIFICQNFSKYKLHVQFIHKAAKSKENKNNKS